MNLDSVKEILTNLDNRKSIFDLEKIIKDNWDYFSPNYPYDTYTFTESFSVLLVTLQGNLNPKVIKTTKSLRNLYSEIYKKIYKSNSSGVKLIDPVEDPIEGSVSKLSLRSLDNSDYLIIFNYLLNPSMDKVPNSVESKSLSKIRINTEMEDNLELKYLDSMNYINLYLLNELGIKKYHEFMELQDKLGIFYPVSILPDSGLVLKIKESIMEKFIDSLNNVTIDNLEVIEKLVLK